MAPPAIVHLIGHPASGKLTVARALAAVAAEDDHRVVVVDNHLTAHPIFTVMDVDGVRDIPSRVWTHVGMVREAVFRTIEELSPVDWSFVFTNVLVADDPRDARAVDRLTRLAAETRRCYVPVCLRCDGDEIARRVAAPERAARMKWIDPDGVRAFVSTHEVLVPDHPHRLDLDTATAGPMDSARAVWDHVRRLP